MSTASNNTPSQALSKAEWCKLNKLSMSTFYKLRKQGLAPDTIAIGGGSIRRCEVITPEATADWRKRMAARSALKPARMVPAGFVLVKKSAKKVEFLSYHETFEQAEAALIADHQDDPAIEIHERRVRVVEDSRHE
jgi:predicted DNA-binding transcriptional regulator AlpA